MLDIKLQSSPLKYKWFGYCSVSFIACEQALRGTLAMSFLSAVIHYYFGDHTWPVCNTKKLPTSEVNLKSTTFK